MHTTSNQTPPQILLLFVLAVATLTALVLALMVPQALFAAVGIACLFAVVFPMLSQKEIDWFSPWLFVILTVFLGCTLSGICISCLWPDPYRIEGMFLLGEAPEFFVYPSIVLVVGLSLMGVGYFSGVSKGCRRAFEKTTWNDGRLYFTTGLLFVISLLATYQYIRNTGGLSSGMLSGKRTVIFDLDVAGDNDFDQFGPTRQLANLSTFAYYLFLAHCLFHLKGLTPGRIIVLMILFLMAVALPFYSSSRLPIVWLFCGTGALFWYSARDMNWKRIAVIGIVGAAVFHFISTIRGKDEMVVQLEEKSGIASVVEGIVLTRNYLGIAKTSHIINAVPEVLELEYGKTFAVWLCAPIPRRMWRDKPLIHSGPIIGAKIYNNKVSGVPPGLIGELYWNFHLPGVLIGCWLAGTLLRGFADRFRPQRGSASLATVIYIVGPMRLGFELLGHSFGFALAITAIDIVTATVILYFISNRRAAAMETRPATVKFPKQTAAARAA